jgi:hypothetical protein
MDLEGPVGSPAPAALLVRSDPVVAGLDVTDRTLADVRPARASQPEPYPSLYNVSIKSAGHH